MSALFGKVCQNGYVVRDIASAMRFWTEVLRVGPFFYIPAVKSDWFRYRGAESAAASHAGTVIEISDISGSEGRSFA